MRRKRSAGDLLRWLARWGPWVLVGAIGCEIGTVPVVINDQGHFPVVDAPLVVVSILLCLFAIVVLRALRPLLLANAERLDALDEERRTRG